MFSISTSMQSAILRGEWQTSESLSLSGAEMSRGRGEEISSDDWSVLSDLPHLLSSADDLDEYAVSYDP